MNKQNNYVEDMINRYIYQVTKNLSSKIRKDIEDELKTLIYDMLEDRTAEKQPAKGDIDAVLTELGSPFALAEKYGDKTHYLIGPAVFPTYLFVLKIVFLATLLGMTIATILDLLTSADALWYEYLGSLFFNLIGGIVVAFGWVTVVFAIFEWRGVNLKELVPEWEVSALPEVPKREIAIPIWEPIVGIVFTIIVMIIFLFQPQLMGTYHFLAGTYSDGMKTIPFFDLEVLKTALPLFLICMSLGILKNIWEIIDRRYSIQYAIVTLITNIVEIVLTIIIFKGFPIWNQNFVTEINHLFNLSSDPTINSIWNTINSNLVIVIVLILIIDAATTMYKALKYDR
jgi:hypothetical protein